LGLTFQERVASLSIDAALYNAMLQGLRAKISETGESELVELLPDSDMEAVSAQDIDLLVDIRTTCRSYKQYALADDIRGWLEGQGISVEDSADGSIWEYRPSS
jgi:cysteinyl-tRNA synthetase